MNSSSPIPTTNFPLTPIFGDNVHDLFGVSALHVNPSSIITVNSTADALHDSNSGVTTLRDAINQANADTGKDLIVFDRSLFASLQTITLSLGELDIIKDLDIIAPRDPLTGGDLVTVSGNKASRVFEIETGAKVTLFGLIIADGQVINDDGGGIKNSGTLILDNSIVRSNNSIFTPLANKLLSGGGIYNTGTLEVSNSTLSGNSSIIGGGISNQGTLIVSNSTLSSNQASQRNSATGGGIYNIGTAKVLNSTINNNIVIANAGSFGGGIFNGGILQVSNSTLNNNLATTGNSGFGGGIYNAGTLEVSNSTLSGNSAPDAGGGIYNGRISTVSNSILNGNSAAEGGGIFNPGTMTVNNSTLSGNSAIGNRFNFPNNGGGIYNLGTLTLVFSTLTLNQAANGSGVYNDNNPRGFSLPPGSVNARNTIIAGNLLSTNGVNPDVSGTYSSNGYNLIGDSTGSTGFNEAAGDIVGTSENPVDPRLASLDFNGGSTQTIALLPDSPAINAADPTVLDTDPTTDQRGFPRFSNGRADIGAFELTLGEFDGTKRRHEAVQANPLGNRNHRRHRRFV